MLNRLWAWVKNMVGRLFRRKKETVEDADRAGNIVGADGKYVSTRRGGPNMPRRQPCPLCRRLVKRKHKTMTGAHYYCRRCKNGAFVRAR